MNIVEAGALGDFDITRRLSKEEVFSIITMPEIEHICRERGEEPVLTHDQTAIEIKIGNWFYYKLRDRRFDGPQWKATKLTSWPYNQSCDIAPENSIEESTYWLNPAFGLEERFAAPVCDFIRDPFAALPFENPTRENLMRWSFLYSDVVSNIKFVYPGFFFIQNIPKLRATIFQRSKEVLKNAGYTHLSAVPTWFHTAGMYEHLGFTFQDATDQHQFEKLKDALQQTFQHPIRQSWQVVYQFWAQLVEQSGYNPEKLGYPNPVVRDGDAHLLLYPLSPTHNVWMNYKLT